MSKNGSGGDNSGDGCGSCDGCGSAGSGRRLGVRRA